MTLYIDQKPTVTSTLENPANGIIRVTFADVTLSLSIVEASWLAANIQREIRSIEPDDYQLRALKKGDVVIVRDDGGIEAEYTVRHEPWQLGHGAWVIGLAGISGGYSLESMVRIVRFAEPKEVPA